MSETENKLAESSLAEGPQYSETYSKLLNRFPDDILSSEIQYDFEVIEFRREALLAIMGYLKDELSYGFLTTLCGLHYPDQKGRELGVMYQLHNLPANKRIRLKTFFPLDDPRIQSLTSIYPTTGWMERQEYDFFGILFDGHPDLRRILNVDDMEYFPMRKEFPLEDATRHDKNDAMFGRD